LRVGDIDDNGNIDMLLSNSLTNKCERYEKIMQPQLHWEMVNDSFAPGVLPYSFITPTVIDFDHDGITDIVTSDPSHFFYKNKGNPDSLVYELQLPNSTYIPAGFYGLAEFSYLDGNCGLDIFKNSATGIEMWGYGGIQPNISDLTVTSFEICDTNTIHLSALPVGGIWGGWVNTNGDLLPSAFPAPGNYWLTYSYSEPQGCFTFTDSILVSITPCTLPLANCSPNSWLAGSIPVSSSVTSGIFTLTNIGLGTLTCSGITGISQPFTTTLVPGSINLTAGQSINFSFTFSPAAVGNYNQTFQLNTNGGIISIDLSGTGIYCPLITGFPYIHDFEGSIFPPDCWIIKDIDGDGNNWKENGIYSAHTGAKAAVSESVASVGLNPDNWLISPPVKISSSIFVLKYWVAAQAQNAPAEHYSILISSSGTNPNNFTEIFNETLSSDTWKLKEVSLSAYNGKNIFIAFRHCNSSNQSALKIDDISVGINTTGMDEYSANNGIVYPNPANDWLYISANRLETVEIYDIVGKRMMSDQSNFKLNIGQLPNGTYMVRIITREGAINRKLLIKHE